MKEEILKQLKPDNIPIQNQVDLLAQFLIENFENEVGKGESPSGEGAIEMAVRLLTKLKEQKLSDCSCGESWTLGVIHRKIAPCYWPPRSDD